MSIAATQNVGPFYYPCILDKNTEAWEGEGYSPRSPSWEGIEPEVKARL